MDRHTSRDDGFTLIELMVVVLIIAILLSIAIPTFLAARTRSSDRAAQGQLRNAITVELVYYSDHQDFTEEPSDLEAIDSSLAYTKLPDTLVPGRNVYVDVPNADLQTVIMGAKSTSGACWWMRAIGTGDKPRFARTEPCGNTVPADSEFKADW